MIQLIANILNTHLSGKMCFSDHMNAAVHIRLALLLMVHKLRFFCSNKSECRFRAEQNHSLIIGKLLYFLQEWVRKIHRNSFHHLRSQNIHSARRICIADQISPVLFHQFHIFQKSDLPVSRRPFPSLPVFFRIPLNTYLASISTLRIVNGPATSNTTCSPSPRSFLHARRVS